MRHLIEDLENAMQEGGGDVKAAVLKALSKNFKHLPGESNKNYLLFSPKKKMKVAKATDLADNDLRGASIKFKKDDSIDGEEEGGVVKISVPISSAMMEDDDAEGDEIVEAVVSDEVSDAGMAYLKTNHKKVSDLILGLTKHVKKETGKSIGMKIAHEVISEFLRVGG